MSVQLLDKTRKINKLLHNSSSSKVVFNDICQVLMDTLSSNILVLSKKGKVLGISLCPGVEEITELIEDNVGGHVDSLLNERFLGVLSTKENVNLQTLGFEHVNSNCQGIINQSILPAKDWGLFLCIVTISLMILKTLSSVNMAQQWLVWK